MDTLYILLIYPLESLMQWILGQAYVVTGSYGFSIVLLSLCINVLVVPLNLLAEKWSFRERILQASMQDDINLIKEVFKGQERFMMLRTLYRQYDYHPIFALRSSLGLFLQIPFFIAAFKFLGSYTALDGVSFAFLSNLAAPDALLSFAGFQINVMPLIMTGISVVTSFVFTQDGTKSIKLQTYGLTALFLVLLYFSPSGLVLYWTCNNIIYLANNIFKKQRKSVDIPKYTSFVLHSMYAKKQGSRNVFSALDRLSLTVPLGFLLCYAFMWSNNAHMFSFISIGISSLVLLATAAILWGGGELWIKISNLIFKKFPRTIYAFNAIIFSGAFAFTLGLFALAVIIVPTPIRPVLMMLWAVIFFCLLGRMTKYLNALMVMVGIISLLRLGGSLILMTQEQAQENMTTQTHIHDVTLVKKPNIYLFWLESYHDFALQESVYNIDTAPMKAYLQKNNFKIYENTYSDGQATLFAFEALFSMGESRAKPLGKLDVMSSVRSLLAGDDRNVVLKNLKDNGYLTQLTFLEHFFYVTGGQRLKNLDVVNYKTNQFTVLHPIIAFIAPSFRTQLFLTHRGSLAEQVKFFTENGLQSGKPFFLTFKGGASHTPVTGYTYEDAATWLAPSGYPALMKAANKELIQIVDGIIERDPQALIILMGDHGSLRFGPLWRGKSVSQFKKQAEAAGIEYKDSVDDIFNVHLSIRLPDGDMYDLAQGHYMSQVNLFTHIFAYLSNNPEVLKTRPVSRSLFYGVEIIKDGKILSQ